MRRTVLAGVLGAIAMFVWMSVAHMMTPLATVGIREIPNEQTVLPAMSAAMGSQHGLYMYPGFDLGPNPSMAQRNAAMPDYQKKLATTPSGILIYKPAGAKAMEGRQLVIEFLKELLMSLIVVGLLAQTHITSFAGKLGFVTLAGVMATVTTNISYWNWFGFPGNYTAAYMLIDLVGFVCVGIVAGVLMKSSGSMSRSATA